jgi:glyoxylase-like metal-dependent hydrolase (beta-lactamase superfamily II)
MIPLEDALEDIIGKAQRGLRLSDEDLRDKADIEEDDLTDLRNGLVREAPLRRVAGVLGLDPDSLVAIARKTWYPEVPVAPGVRQFRDEVHSMCPNAYLVYDANGDAVIFDTTSDARPIIDAVREGGLEVGAICLTHTHPDHVQDLERLQKEFPGVPVYIGRNEPFGDATLLDEGEEIRVSDLVIEARQTSGHSPGGMTYLIRQGLSRPVAVVGDALFAGSMGGSANAWPEALANNRSKLFTLSNETIICPGHGPMSDIGQEKRHNPFYPELKTE